MSDDEFERAWKRLRKGKPQSNDDYRKPRLMLHEPKTDPELYRRLAEIEAYRASLPPEERARIEADEREAQRQSWARQDMD